MSIEELEKKEKHLINLYDFYFYVKHDRNTAQNYWNEIITIRNLINSIKKSKVNK